MTYQEVACIKTEKKSEVNVRSEAYRPRGLRKSWGAESTTLENGDPGSGIHRAKHRVQLRHVLISQSGEHTPTPQADGMFK